MEQDLKTKNIGWVLTVSFLVGLICSCMMLVSLETESARQTERIILQQWEKLSVDSPQWEQWLTVGIRLFFPGVIWLTAIFCLGLWRIGQPLMITGYLISGILCGGYGTVFMQQNIWLFLFWYLPFVVLLFLLQLTVGIRAMRLSLFGGKEYGGYFWSFLRQICLVLLLALAAAAVWICLKV